MGGTRGCLLDSADPGLIDYRPQPNRLSHMTLDAAASVPLYARFSRRFRGIVIDWAIAMAVLFGALMLAVSVENVNFSRGLGILVIAILVLYEPIMVSF